VIDIHFHGAFGIDLMTASSSELKTLAARLGKAGLAGFCATTLSAPRTELKAVVARLGQWIRQTEPDSDSAIPLGIHLEGPFIGPAACGAHPPGSIRPVDMAEIEELWEASLHTLKIMTVAPEAFIKPSDRAALVGFCKKNRIRLSLGHTACTEKEAQKAFDLGFKGLTHAWNALGFHHRTPGAMGAALGRKKLSVELIIDQIHASLTTIRWTLKLHEKQGRVCFVSDAAPAAETSGREWYSFGSLKIRYHEGASRLQGGHLAGGGHLLPRMYVRWLEAEAKAQGKEQDPVFLRKLLKKTIRHLTIDPLHFLGVHPSRLKSRRLMWKVRDNRVRFD
jgi:N-acetylgalactosamine-6-phosphate deacetylase